MQANSKSLRTADACAKKFGSCVENNKRNQYDVLQMQEMCD